MRAERVDRGNIPESVRAGGKPRELAAQAKSRWRKDRLPDAAEFLARHATIRRDRSLALDLAYEEYCIRIDNGEELDAVDFCQRFPSLHRSLKRQIEVDQFLREREQMDQLQIEWPRTGDPLMGFRVVGQIAQGAFARVYLCAQSDIGDRQVVVKVAYQGAPEADTMGRLSHPNIISIHSVEVDAATDLSYICMPFYGRSTLYDLIDIAFGQDEPPSLAHVVLEAARSSIRPEDRYQRVAPRVPVDPRASYVTGILRLAIQIAEALEHAHARGVLHGDLKPSNVVLSIDGMPLVVDFNLSLGPGQHPLLAGGTLPYMPPEVIRLLLWGADADDAADVRSDIFSLGAVLYELLSGVLPFLPARSSPGSTSAVNLLDAQAHGTRGLHEINPAVDAQLAAFVNRCLAFDPHDRPQSMTEVCLQLRRHLSRSRRTVRFFKERRGLATLLAATAASVTLGGIWYHRSQPASHDRHYAQGLAHFQRGDYPEAMASFSQTIRLNPTSFEAVFARGCAAIHQHGREGRPELLAQATRDFTRAGELRADPRVLIGQSFICLQQNEFDTAANAMEMAIQQGIDSKEVWNNLGYAYSKLVGLNSTNPQVYGSLISKADASLRQAIERDENFCEAHLNFAILSLTRYRMSNQSYVPRAGLRSIQRVIDLRPTDVTIFFCAAKLAGVVAEADDDDALWSMCIDYLDQAQRRGMDLQMFKAGHPFSEIANDPRFVALLDRQPILVESRSIRRVVHPEMISPEPAF